MIHLPRHLTWFSRNIISTKGTLNELREHLPRFQKVPFEIKGEGINPYLFMIVRDRIKDNERSVSTRSDDDTVQIPVSIVSKEYQLVQHHDVLNALAEVLQQNGFDLDQIQAQLSLTKYGERMWFSLTLPAHSHNPSVYTYFDPGDGHPVHLTVNALNSVDKITALEIKLLWYRLICSNGLIYGDNIDFKEIHRTDTLDVDAIRKFLQKQFAKEQFEKEKQRLLKWWETQVNIEDWLENVVSKKWGIHAAARTQHIAKTGKDAKFKMVSVPVKNQKVKYTDLATTPNSEGEVPGVNAPVTNAYGISQILSWLANQQGTLQEGIKRMEDIPKLMQALLRNN
ncbi:MAG: DUF932 domain-containing protein [Candidatus Poribacteria bacterium]|nr:DUF932 domain-containing protein [Candidatus Poribacteria bacterium]